MFIRDLIVNKSDSEGGVERVLLRRMGVCVELPECPSGAHDSSQRYWPLHRPRGLQILTICNSTIQGYGLAISVLTPLLESTGWRTAIVQPLSLSPPVFSLTALKPLRSVQILSLVVLSRLRSRIHHLSPCIQFHHGGRRLCWFS